MRAALRFGAVLALLAVSVTLNAKVIRVNGDSGKDANDGSTWSLAKQTIDSALKAASPGDEIWVRKSTYGYYPNTPIGPGVGVYGGFGGTETGRDQRKPATYVTTINYGLNFAPECQADTVVDGFTYTSYLTITDASPTLSSLNIVGNTVALVRSSAVITHCTLAGGYHGAISCSGGAPTITGNTMTASTEDWVGAGIRCESASATITGNKILACSASTPTVDLARGGGIYVKGGSVSITDNDINDNTSFLGAGIYCECDGAIISGNRLRRNRNKYGNSSGGGIYYVGTGGSTLNNRITGCITDQGAGIYCAGSAVIANNFILANAGDHSSALCVAGAGVRVVNNTILANETAVGATVVLGGTGTEVSNNLIACNSSGVGITGTDNPIFSSNDVYDNSGLDYIGVADPTGTNGNISSDPAFANFTYGKLGIQPSSPCVDAGDDSKADASWTDIDGQPRIQGAHVDIGADESDGTAWDGHPAIIRVSTKGNDANDGSSWTLTMRTVSAAVAQAAKTGGEVWVQAGEYIDSVDLPQFMRLYGGFAGTETTRSERDSLTNTTILTGNPIAIKIEPGHGPFVVLDGFTVRGRGFGSSDYAISATYASPCIQNNIITQYKGSTGSGVDLHHCSASISNNVITGNAGFGISSEWYKPAIRSNQVTSNGVGISCVGDAVITDNLISWNQTGLHCNSGRPRIASNRFYSNSYSYGGNYASAIFCESSHAEIYGNDFRGNVGASAIYISGALTPTVANNIISFNSAYEGPAIYVSACAPLLSGNTIVGNFSSSGSAVYSNGATPTLANNIIAFNTHGIGHTGDGGPSFVANDVFGNSLGNFVGVTDPTGSDGNISVDPKLASRAYGNFHIQPDSPCVDAGDGSWVRGEGLDIDAQPRVRGAHVDIGADESDGTVWNQPPAIVHVSLSGVDTNDGLTWDTPKRTIAAGIAAATSGGEVWVATGSYHEALSIPGGVYLYGGFAGGEGTRDERDWARNLTTIDCYALGDDVSIAGSENASAIDGFTIANGGISCAASATVQHNTISGGSYGISVAGASFVADNTITGSTGNGYPNRVVINASGSPTIVRNRIQGNTACALTASGSPTFRNNVVSGNLFTGDCVYVVSGDVSDNLFIANAGTVMIHTYIATVSNNTVVANTVTDDAIVADYNRPTIVNNVVAFNESGLKVVNNATPTLKCNDVYGNALFNYSGLSDATGSNGNISADPKLANLSLCRWHVQPDSPCRDAGDDAFVASGDTDAFGHPRVEGPHVDIGGEESNGTRWDAEPRIVRVKPDGDDANDGSTWDLAKKTIQAAASFAGEVGGELWVKEGTYSGCSTIPAGVYLYGGFAGIEDTRGQRDSTTHVTVLDGQSAGSVLTLALGEHLNTVDGFTVQHGFAANGAGICCLGGSPYIANNVVRLNVGLTSANSFGIGIHMAGGVGEIVDNVISDNGRSSLSYAEGAVYVSGHAHVARNQFLCNSVNDGGGVCFTDSPIIENNVMSYSITNYGGGIECWQGATAAKIRGNTITHNSAARTGGGISLETNKDASDILNNVVTGNTAPDGGGIFISYTKGTLVNNLIGGNTTTGVSGGTTYGTLVCGGSPTLTGNTVAGNVATAGAAFYWSGHPTLANNIFAFNTGGFAWYSSSACDCRNNDFFLNGNTYFSSDPVGTNGNISADPLFASLEYGDFHIQPGSPCADAGSDADVAPGAVDVDGQPRIQGPHVDIGADESDGTIWHVAPPKVIRVSTAGDDRNDGLSSLAPKRMVQAAVGALAGSVGEIWVREGTYAENLTLGAGVSLYGGFTGIESYRSQRDAKAHQTVLDGGMKGSVITISGGLGAVDGFVIQNGKSQTGGGITCAASATQILNNVIQNNVATNGSTTGYGGGLYLSEFSGTVENNVIRSNAAIGTGTADGGAIYAGNSSLYIVGNTIDGNVTGPASSQDQGGGLFTNYGQGQIANNVFSRNVAGDGGGLVTSLMTRASVLISGNTVTGNRGRTGAGGMRCDARGYDYVTIQGNTISGNTGATAGGFTTYYAKVVGNRIFDNVGVTAGGCNLRNAPTTYIADNFVYHNVASTSGGGMVATYGLVYNNTIAWNYAPTAGGIQTSHYATLANNVVAFNSTGVWTYAGEIAPTFKNNCVFGNDIANYVGFSTDPTGTNGNLSVDPKLADLNMGDLHLQPDSPCVDVGNDGAVVGTWGDIDGQSRVQGGHVDIGADESDGSNWDARQTVVQHVSPDGADGNDGLSWLTAKQTVTGALTAALPGDEVWVAAGTYGENITLKHGVKLYGGFIGTETSRSQRVLGPTTLTALDGGGDHTRGVVTIEQGALRSTVLDGFVIRHGNAPTGGGILCAIAGPTISDNTITSCGATTRGGGGALNGSLASLTANAITYNVSSVAGAGIDILKSSPWIADNRIANNTATGRGGGINSDNSTPTVLSNVFSGNTASMGGGASFQAGLPFLANNTFFGNTATDGGALCLDGTSDSPWVAGNIAVGNSSGIYCVNGLAPNARNNDLYGNTSYNYWPTSGDPTGTLGNVSTDPQFVDGANGNFRLAPGSPCVDAGCDDAVYSGELDMDLQSRIVGSHADIGAYETATATAAGHIVFGQYVGLVPVAVTFEVRYPNGAVCSPQIPVGSDGSYTVAVPAGVFQLSLKPGTWLRRTVQLDTTGGSVSGVGFELLNGDANGDNRVGIGDLATVLAAFGTTFPSGDLDGNGEVGIADISVVLLNFNKVGDR